MAAGGKETTMKRLPVLLMVAALLASSLAGPTQAQRLGLFFGDERTDFAPERAMCLTDYQIRQAVADLGYRDITLNVPMNKRIQVRASQGGWVYLLEFNYCSARIESRIRLRPTR